MKPLYELGQTVYYNLDLPYSGKVALGVITGITITEDGIRYSLEGSKEFCMREAGLYSTRDEVIKKAIEEENRVHEIRIDRMKSLLEK